MSRIIAFVNQKGGVGKTTTAVNVASFLALSGPTVLLIDIDPQANATSGLGIDPRQLDRGIYDVLIGQKQLRDVLFQTEMNHMHIAPATMALAGAGVELVGMEQREYRLDAAIQSIAQFYDYVIIDCPPSLGLLTVNALTAAREVIIPVQCEYYALEGLSQLLNTIQLVQTHLQPALQITGAVITMFDKRNRLSVEVLKEVKQHFPYHVFSSIIPRNVKLAESPSHGKPIALYDKRSKGGRTYRLLSEEIAALAH